MSWWSYIKGTIEVDPQGRTIDEQEFILKNALKHQPMIYQDGGIMETLITKSNYPNLSSSHDEFDEWTNLIYDRDPNYPRGFYDKGTKFFITVDANIRDQMFKETLKQFTKWILHLSTKIPIDSCLVKIYDYDKSIILDWGSDVFTNKFINSDEKWMEVLYEWNPYKIYDDEKKEEQK